MEVGTAMKVAIRAMAFASAMGIPALVALAFPTSANASYTVCNDTSEALTVAVGYIDAKGFVSEGWWNLTPNGGCKVVVGDGDATDLRNYWVYAKTSADGSTWSGGGETNWFCAVSGQRFLIHRKGCTERGFGTRDFEHVQATSDDETTHLRDGTGHFD
jgi:uncharacterized membrane protein